MVTRVPWNRRKDRLAVYVEPRDVWVGYFRGDTHHYVCPLPCIVIRWPRHRLVYRAGWPDTGTPRVGRRWLRLGPWVIGDTDAWDRSDTP